MMIEQPERFIIEVVPTLRHLDKLGITEERLRSYAPEVQQSLAQHIVVRSVD